MVFQDRTAGTAGPGQPVELYGAPHVKVCDVPARVVDHGGLASQNRSTVTLPEFRGGTGGRKAAELFRTGGQGLALPHQPDDLFVTAVPAVMTAGDSCKAGAHDVPHGDLTPGTD